VPLWPAQYAARPAAAIYGDATTAATRTRKPTGGAPIPSRPTVINRDPIALADRLWPKFELDPEFEAQLLGPT
jgi:hypothetical protein